MPEKSKNLEDLLESKKVLKDYEPSLFGLWQDEKSSDEILDKIRNFRIQKNEINLFGEVF